MEHIQSGDKLREVDIGLVKWQIYGWEAIDSLPRLGASAFTHASWRPVLAYVS